MKEEYTVYLHICPEGKRYYGATKLNVNRRWRKNGEGYEKQEDFWEAINKYGWDNFQHIVVAKGLTKDEAYWLEEILIETWNTRNTDKGYNITKGGHGTNGWNPSKGTRKKIGEANSGRHPSEEARKKMSEAKKDKYVGKNHPCAKSVICITTNRIFLTSKEGAEYYNCNHGNITSCCKGKLKSAGKYNGKKLIWKYIKWNHNKIYRIKDFKLRSYLVAHLK